MKTELVVSVLIITGSILAVSACAGAGTHDREKLLGSTIEQDALSIVVLSTGCTTKEDFSFHVARTDASRIVLVTVNRERADVCRAMPRPVKLSYSRREIGVGPDEAFTVTNEVSPFKSPTRS